MSNDPLGDRMKFFESVSTNRLVPKVPVVMRLDGVAFHTLTRGMDRPWDKKFVEVMQKTTLDMCKTVQGCVFGYVQSDEISLVLIDWNKYSSTLWFDGKVQKMCSVGAAMATKFFNKHFNNSDKLGVFDCRVFNVPEHDVVNNILWRQRDAERNSIQMLARDNFSHSDLYKKSTNQIQEMLITQKDVNWNDMPTYLKRGTAVKRQQSTTQVDSQDPNPWQIDYDMPILSQQRDYVPIPDRFKGENK